MDYIVRVDAYDPGMRSLALKLGCEAENPLEGYLDLLTSSMSRVDVWTKLNKSCLTLSSASCTATATPETLLMAGCTYNTE